MLMRDEVLYQRGNTLVRRLRLEPGEAMPWHVDPHRRFGVVVEGRSLAIQYRDGDDSQQFQVEPGQSGWDEPTDRPHRGVNTGEVPYEEVTIFFLDGPGAVPQPSVDLSP
jgi:quercetin dioxygenase-like cupin family protein